MNWLTNTFGSSVGKKLMMAVTGLFFCVFLVLHLAGNMTIYMGEDVFNSYAEHLHSLGPLLILAEWGLLFFAIIHISTGLFLFYQNFKARPTRYAVNKRAGGRTLGSATMPYTGVILLLFVIYHLFNFHFVDKTHTTISQIVSTAFAQAKLCIDLYVCHDHCGGSCQSWILECISDPWRQSSEIHALIKRTEPCIQSDCRNRVWFYSGLCFAISIVSIHKRGFLLKIKACEKNYHRHMIDIPRIIF